MEGTPACKQRVDDEKAAKKAAESVYTTVAESTVYTTLAIVGSAI
jgi:hypothetical protein